MILHLQILSTYDQLPETCGSASIIRTSLVLTGPPQPHSQMSMLALAAPSPRATIKGRSKPAGCSCTGHTPLAHHSRLQYSS